MQASVLLKRMCCQITKDMFKLGFALDSSKHGTATRQGQPSSQSCVCVCVCVQGLALALSCLSYDFVGTCADDSSEDMTTIQVCWLLLAVGCCKHSRCVLAAFGVTTITWCVCIAEGALLVLGHA